MSSDRASPAHSRRRPPLLFKPLRSDKYQTNEAGNSTANVTGANVTTANVTTANGTSPNVSTADGTTADGTTANGTTANGTTADGTTADGTTANGTTANGTGANGTRANGAGGEGAGGDGLTPSVALVPVVAHPRRGRAGWGELTTVFVVSLGLALALFHRDLSDLFSSQLGGAGDADEYSWFLSWVPFALGHGLNPLLSTFVNYPTGVNLMWNTSVLLPSLLMSPVTVIFGAAFSYNVLITLAPALSCTFAHMAFRRWTGRLPAMVGALIFGFSPYMIAQSVGHLAQTLIMSAPLLLILLDRLLVVQSSTPWRDGLLLGLLGSAQLLTGEEVLAMEAVTGAIALVVVCYLGRREIPLRSRYAWRGLAVAGGLFGVLSAPFLAYQYLGPYNVQDVHPANTYVSDLLNFVVPTNVTQLAPAAALRVSAHFTGNGVEQNAYIGIPLVVFIILALVLARRRPLTWVALAVGGGAAVLSMGPTLHVLGHVSHLDLPDHFLAKLPVLHNLLPDRFASMMTLGEALLVALGLDELKHFRWPAVAGGWALAGAGMAAIFPMVHFPANASPLFDEFTSGLPCPATGPGHPPGRPPVALVVPTVNELDLRWQAESKYCFVTPSATGMTGTNSRDLKLQGVLLTLANPRRPMSPTTPAIRAEAAEEIQALDIKEIIVVPQSPAVPNWRPQQQAEAVVWVEWLVGQAPQQGLSVYRAYFWKNLPPVGDIASGHVGTVPGAPAP